MEEEVLLGLAAGFLAPPLLVRPHDDPADIGHDLKMLTLGVAASSSLIAALTVLLFKDRPELPPSPAQAQERAGRPEVTCQGFARALRRLWANGNYRLMLACNGIANGSLNVVVTVLSPVVLSHFPDGQEFAGRVGVVIILAGLLGCVVFGALLDRTHKYNIFLVGFMPIALEMSAEVTYPESESTVGNLLFIPSNVLGIAMSMAFTEIMQRWGDLSAILFVCASLAAGALLASFVGRDYRRLAANSGDKPAPSRGKHELIVN
ncbi:heme transporter FLVCR2-like [Bacillus rossius redtenbacheri]|uniref:heme transporter FLVCR2-like n=1 Tax=Bacillus rossius redtenbacheri TaxID=93214 RepID=UPI002FDE52B8